MPLIFTADPEENAKVFFQPRQLVLLRLAEDHCFRSLAAARDMARDAFFSRIEISSTDKFHEYGSHLQTGELALILEIRHNNYSAAGHGPGRIVRVRQFLPLGFRFSVVREAEKDRIFWPRQGNHRQGGGDVACWRISGESAA